MVFRGKKIDVCFENRTKHINTMCGKMESFFVLKQVLYVVKHCPYKGLLCSYTALTTEPPELKARLLWALPRCHMGFTRNDFTVYLYTLQRRYLRTRVFN